MSRDGRARRVQSTGRERRRYVPPPPAPPCSVEPRPVASGPVSSWPVAPTQASTTTRCPPRCVPPFGAYRDDREPATEAAGRSPSGDELVQQAGMDEAESQLDDGHERRSGANEILGLAGGDHSWNARLGGRSFAGARCEVGGPLAKLRGDEPQQVPHARELAAAARCRLRACRDDRGGGAQCGEVCGRVTEAVDALLIGLIEAS